MGRFQGIFVLLLLAGAAPTAQRARAATTPSSFVIQTDIVGDVRLPDGGPAAGARVSTPVGTAITDASGSFSIPASVGPGRRIVASAALRILGANYGGSSAPVAVVEGRTQVGTVTLERRSFPLFFAP